MTSVLIFLAVLSLLIFWHELGHFLAAKACGVYVDRFSIGMPPRLFGIKIGETDYCISALPIGGYVKMAGQEDVPLTEEEREKQYGEIPPDRWLSNKPVWQRQITFLAGPLMNYALAVALYAGIGLAGSDVPEWEVTARIGVVDASMPASSAPLYRVREGAAPESYQGAPDAAGWQTGDLVRTVDGEPVKNITDVAIAALLGGADKTYYVHISRDEADGTTVEYVSPIRPGLKEGEERPRFGIDPYQSAVVAEILEGHPVAQSGLRTGDKIVMADGRHVDLRTFISYLETLPPGASVRLQVLRGGQRIAIELPTTTLGRVQGLEAYPEEEGKPGLAIAAISSELAAKTKLQRKDVIVSIDGEPATKERLSELERAKAGDALKIEVRRPSILFGFIQKASNLSSELPVSAVQAIGVKITSSAVFQRLGLLEAIPNAFRQSYLDLKRTIQTVHGLITRTLSPKDIGGPVMIFDATYKAAQFGFMELLRITAFISVNLCVLNLLPIPALDGGQMVIQGYEGIFRRPLSLRIQERFQQVGVAFILFLMVFVTWNDIGRVIQNMMP